MKTQTYSFSYTACSLDQLDEQDRALIEKAKEATSGSYAPYSRFLVGAAVLLDDGTIVTGSNQENAAYPSGTCAERCALFYAGAHYPEAHPVTLAIAARNADGFTEQPISPCGACRQVMVETVRRSGRPMRLLLYGTQTCYAIDNALYLIPFAFDEF